MRQRQAGRPSSKLGVEFTWVVSTDRKQAQMESLGGREKREKETERESNALPHT